MNLRHPTACLTHALMRSARSHDTLGSALVAVQTFRVAGVVVLFCWWIGTLPTIFAWVAGL